MFQITGFFVNKGTNASYFATPLSSPSVKGKSFAEASQVAQGPVNRASFAKLWVFTLRDFAKQLNFVRDYPIRISVANDPAMRI
jgi:hypothetical protein